jgi:hypothetical protein
MFGPRPRPAARPRESLADRDGGCHYSIPSHWHYRLRGPKAGDESLGRAVLEEIVEAERIVFVDSFSMPTATSTKGCRRPGRPSSSSKPLGGLA